MRLENKETGEIGYFSFANQDDPVLIVMDKNGVQLAKYSSLAELNAEWCDAPEEPKGIQCIYYTNHYDTVKLDGVIVGFGSKEEAELAVRKLKALKQLKDNGMKKYSFRREKRGIDLDYYTLTILAPRDKDSLDLLFGGKE